MCGIIEAESGFAGEGRSGSRAGAGGLGSVGQVKWRFPSEYQPGRGRGIRTRGSSKLLSSLVFSKPG